MQILVQNCYIKHILGFISLSDFIEYDEMMSSNLGENKFIISIANLLQNTTMQK